MLEAQTAIQFGYAVANVDAFIKKKKKIEPLLNWLQWWVDRKEHILRVFKDRSSPELNLAEIVYSAWVTSNQACLCLYEAAADDITGHVTVKQVLIRYHD